MANLTVESVENWHEIRAKHIGASEVAALFNLSPYMSRWTLWQIKAGKIPAPQIDSQRVQWGNRLEAAIAEGLAEDHGWNVRKVHRYITHPTIEGMGTSLDYEIFNHPDGPGVLEIKNVDGLIFRNKWEEAEDLQAPMHIELQLQHQLAVTGRAWGVIGVLVGGNDAKYTVRKRHEPTIQKIETGVQAFWESIANGNEPKISEGADLSIVSDLFDGTETVTLNNPLFEHLCQGLKAAQQAEKEAKTKVEEAKLKLIEILDQNNAEVAIGQGFKASYKQQTRAEHIVKESTFRVLRISEIKQKDAV